MQRYLDITKSVIISSPAGSGKTEKLSRRYIALLKAGSDVEKILCITFTEKAASEMKQRILDILSKEDPELLRRINAVIPLMRISTIHSFCLRMLKRFSIELGIDPSLSVMDELASGALWSEALFECIESERAHPAMLSDMIKERGIRGGDSIISLLNELYRNRPRPELILREGHSVLGADEKRILELYSSCLKIYEEKKLQRHLLDFDDLELLTYEALSRGSEWHNILYAFDEHTDHLLVDEFQDTSTLQWKIIDKLTEEWRSGMGAKRDMGKIPTIFLVGDEKQSIYQFRGANVSVFEEAKQKFSEWLGSEYQFEEAKENFRSLPAIIDFANSLFEKLMPAGLFEKWKTRYCPFRAVRKGQGMVELMLLEGSHGTKQNRIKEADMLAKAVKGMYGIYQIFDRDFLSKRQCRFSDMAILLRRRTYLSVFENSLRRHGIPFIVQKGIGFYDEPEIAMLREFISFIVDPEDSYSVFNLRRSPIFGVDYKTLLRSKTHDELEAIREMRLLLNEGEVSLAMLIEDMLTKTKGWSHFWEGQRHANVKKFISMIEGFEAAGLSPLEIRERLLRQRHVSEVPKANVNAEEMDAVRIMTVHAAKGLQFPIVFIPSLDEGSRSKPFQIAVDDEPDRITLGYEPDASKRKNNALFERLKQKRLEEEKRLFYVAITRAMDYLMMSGVIGDGKIKGRLDYIESAFNIKDGHTASEIPFKVLKEGDIHERYSRADRISLVDAGAFIAEPSYTGVLQYEPALNWRNVTEDIDIRARHGDDWVIIGRLMHRVFEGLSKGIILEDDIKERVGLALKEEALVPPHEARVFEIIMGDFEKLKNKGFLDEVILPSPSSFSELPFNIEIGRTVFKGRIDRLMLKGKEALLYDYKTFPVKDKEMPELIQKYRFQMDIYKEAVIRIFRVKARAYLLFTHLPKIVEI